MSWKGPAAFRSAERRVSPAPAAVRPLRCRGQDAEMHIDRSTGSSGTAPARARAPPVRWEMRWFGGGGEEPEAVCAAVCAAPVPPGPLQRASGSRVPAPCPFLHARGVVGPVASVFQYAGASCARQTLADHRAGSPLRCSRCPPLREPARRDRTIDAPPNSRHGAARVASPPPGPDGGRAPVPLLRPRASVAPGSAGAPRTGFVSRKGIEAPQRPLEPRDPADENPGAAAGWGAAFVPTS